MRKRLAAYNRKDIMVYSILYCVVGGFAGFAIYSLASSLCNCTGILPISIGVATGTTLLGTWLYFTLN